MTADAPGYDDIGDDSTADDPYLSELLKFTRAL